MPGQRQLVELRAFRAGGLAIVLGAATVAQAIERLTLPRRPIEPTPASQRSPAACCSGLTAISRSREPSPSLDRS